MNKQKNQRLMARLAGNYQEYRALLLEQEPWELIDMAERISDTAVIYQYLTREHTYTEAELDMLLRFQNPLEVVASHAAPYMSLRHSLDWLLHDLSAGKVDLTGHPRY